MRIGKRACALVISLGLPCIGYAQQAAAAPAQADSAMEERLKALEEKVIELEGQLRAMKNAQAYTAAGAAAPATPPATAAGGQAAAESTQAAQTLPQPEVAPARLGGAGGNAKLLNPDIGVIGDFIGSAGYNPIRPTPSLQMHESEVSLQAIIDPYARGDFFISFGEEGVGVEEGYITFTALPAGLVARVGKMRAAFGKVNTLHNHVLPWIDRPLVTDNLVGGEDGIDDAGFSVTRSFSGPKNIFLEATGQVFRGDSSDVFQAAKHSNVSTVAHFRGYKDISDSTNLDLGISYARGTNALQVTDLAGVTRNSGRITNLFGVDATLRYKPLRRAIYKSFIARSEFMWNQADARPGDFFPGQLGPSGFPAPVSRFQRSFGYYVSADYQFARLWTVGARYDNSDRQYFDSLTDRGGSLVLTYRPTEFSQIRGQYRVTNYANGSFGQDTGVFYPNGMTTNEFRIQFQFALGAHGAHPF
jgi:hypothetical protein